MITNITFRTIVSFFSRKNIKNKIEKVDQTINSISKYKFFVRIEV